MTRTTRLSMSLLIATACGGDSSAKHADAGPPPVDAADDTPWCAQVTDETGSAVGSAQACVPTETDVACATTDVTGAVTLEFPIPPGTTVDYDAVAVTAPGHLGGVTLITNSQAVLGGFDPVVWTQDYAAQILGSDAGFPVPSATTGYVLVESLAAGATATIAPAGSAVYLDGSGNPDPTLVATSASGAILFGNVPPGRVAITVTLDGQSCGDGEPADGLLAGVWPAVGSESVDAYVVAGALTESVYVHCPE
jgi:hypothetical protein